MNLRKTLLGAFLVLVSACDESRAPNASDEVERAPLGKADNAGSCAQTDCDGPAPVGNCWCDEQCSSFGDCCADYEPICEGAPEEPATCGGFAGLLCDPGFECVDDPDDACDPEQGGADCLGICVEQEEPPQTCGGFLGVVCPEGTMCVDDPSDSCDPSQGGADCLGICVEQEEPPQTCGGFLGVVCPEGTMCVDDPSDSCDPATSGADCLGICV